MAFDSHGRRLPPHNGNGGDGISKRTCLFIVSLPIVFTYIGYRIGMSFTTDHNIMSDRGVVMDASRLNYSWYGSHNVTMTFRGNLGNQLFQYAALYGLAKANGLKPLVPDNLKIVKMFPGLKSTLTSDPDPGRSFHRFRETKAMAFEPRSFSLNFMKNIELAGFFQSWRYFDHVRAEIREQLWFPEQADKQVQTVLHEALQTANKNFFDASKPPPVFVGIHVRRGDLLSDENIAKGYVTASQSYFAVSMDYFINKYKQVIFVVTTDDMTWSKEHVKMRGGNPVIFSPFEHTYPAIDLCLLAHCNHTIMTVGTFGWWGAWLAGGETVYYKKFPTPFSPVSKEFKRTDYFLPHWYGV